MVHRQFPMIPPQVNGATRKTLSRSLHEQMFPMIPPQVNGATAFASVNKDPRVKALGEFPMIPPQVNGATVCLQEHLILGSFQ